jgi:hypothetical protein
MVAPSEIQLELEVGTRVTYPEIGRREKAVADKALRLDAVQFDEAVFRSNPALLDVTPA